MKFLLKTAVANWQEVHPWDRQMAWVVIGSLGGFLLIATLSFAISQAQHTC